MLQSAVPDAYRGRVLGAFSMLYSTLALVGMALGSTLGDQLGPVPLLLFAGGLDILGGLLALILLGNPVWAPVGNASSCGET